jgi:hypothetical protein
MFQCYFCFCFLLRHFYHLNYYFQILTRTISNWNIKMIVDRGRKCSIRIFNPKWTNKIHSKFTIFYVYLSFMFWLWTSQNYCFTYDECVFPFMKHVFGDFFSCVNKWNIRMNRSYMLTFMHTLSVSSCNLYRRNVLD